MKKIDLKISKIPPSVNVIWINKARGRYKSKKGKEFETLATYEIKKQYKGEIKTNALKVKIIITFKDKRRRDVDNYNKGILDAMTGLIYEDDSQIVELHTIKRQGNKEGVAIEIEEV